MKIYIPDPWGPYLRPHSFTAVEYRRDPVPGTRCRRGSGYGQRVLRRPRTTQERRAYFHDEIAEYGVRIRGRRSAHALPNAWDDICRSDIFTKNWKKQRRTQYRG